MISRCLAAVAVLMTATAVAHATTLDFDYQFAPGPIVIDASWTAVSTPTPIGYAVGSYTNIAVSNGIFEFGALGGPLTSGSFSDVTFYNAAFSGPFGPGGFQASLVGDFGAQIYAGSEASPMFSAGVYPLAFGTLTISAVPEPAAWSLMLLGVAGLGATLRRSRRQRAAA